MDYQGRGLSTTISTIVQINPCIHEIENLSVVQDALRSGDYHAELSLTSTGMHLHVFFCFVFF
jgi:hypothetical protein